MRQFHFPNLPRIVFPVSWSICLLWRPFYGQKAAAEIYGMHSNELQGLAIITRLPFGERNFARTGKLYTTVRPVEINPAKRQVIYFPASQCGKKLMDSNPIAGARMKMNSMQKGQPLLKLAGLYAIVL